MKRRMISFLTVLFLLVAAVLPFSGCSSDVENYTITPEGYPAGTTLLDVMEDLQEKGKLTFKAENGMITSLQGTDNTTNSYWMLYTSDEKNANLEWGSITVDGKTLGSAIYGASELQIENGETYVWSYESF